VFKIHLLTETEVTFLLTSGGHNAGIVSEPGHAGRHFQVMMHCATRGHLDPDGWLARAERKEGSWWPEWGDWLAQRSSPAGPPPAIGNANNGFAPLGPAPGGYVLAR